MAREWLIATIESAYGTIKSSPTVNTEYIPVRLSEDNSFTMRKVPIRQTIRTADTRNRRAFTLSKRTQYEGQLKCLAYVAHMPLICQWATSMINSGQSSPWTTTERPNDLASCTIDHAIEDPSAGTVTKTRYTGVKVASMEAVWDNQTDYGKVTLNLVGKTSTTHTQTEPADSDYPSAVYCLQDLTTIKFGSTTTNIRSFRLSVANTMAKHFDEAATLSYCRMKGRDVNFGSQLLYKIGTDRRDAFTALTAQDCEFTFTSGSNTMKFDFDNTNYIGSLEDSLPLGDEFSQDMTVEAFYDTSVDGDLAVTFT